MKPAILVVDDDVAVCELLQDVLSEHVFTVLTCHSGQDAVNRVQQDSGIALVLLDMMLPDINGLQVLLQLQKQRPSLPVVMLTGLGSESDVVVGLEMGADDYIAKPFSPREVCARVRTVLRRLQKFAAPSPVVRVGEFVLDEQAAAISWFGQPLNLTRYEFLLLKTLLHAPGRVFSRQQLMELVWIDAWESLDRTVDTHIKTLRAKLRAVNPEKAPINTHRGMGYSLGRG
ncbi:MAG TPA: two-component system response regulator CreB [Klebsiella pneumoniae]|nr:two-component system response regulator CreB [Klebsiella pneumoniae]